MLFAGALATSLQPPPLPSLAFASSEYADPLAGFALTVPAGLYAKQRGVRTKPDDIVVLEAEMSEVWIRPQFRRLRAGFAGEKNLGVVPAPWNISRWRS